MSRSTLEAEPNDKSDAPQAINLPAVVSGRFDQPRDADWFAFTPPEDGQFAIEVYAERLAAQADPYRRRARRARQPRQRVRRLRPPDQRLRRPPARSGRQREPAEAARNTACSCRTAISAAGRGFSTC